MYSQFQEELLRVIRNKQREPLPAAIEQAYWSTPRHLFVKRFYQQRGDEWESTILDEGNIDVKLPLLYQDTPIVLVVDTKSPLLGFKSSISQPSLVLSMLKKLDIREGDSVLEIGAGSGWNAAMMGRLAGPTGNVYSVEIIPELIESARETIAGLGIGNVKIIEGDGGYGYAQGAPYDRIIFTAGSYDIPTALFQQLKDGGLLLMVLKHIGFGDTLYLFRKTEGRLESIESWPCSFVGLQGKYQLPELNPVEIGSLPFWEDIKDLVVHKQPFWCGGKTYSNEHFIAKTMGLVSFLGIVEPSFRAFEIRREGERRRRPIFYGVVEDRSVVTMSHEDQLIAYGSRAALDRLLGDLRLWQELGMPDAACFKLAAFPADRSLSTGERQWIVKRVDSQFLWTLEGAD